MVLQAMWLKHDHHLQGLAALMRYVGHEKLPDPEEWGLRGTILGYEARLVEAGLQCEREGRSAGSLWYIPSLAHLW
jgi:hypothetical protein